MIIAGAALIVAGVLVSVGLYTGLRQTHEVIVVAAPVIRGERIERADLATAHVSHDPALTPVSADLMNDIVGQYALADLTPGTFLAGQAVGSRISPQSGQAEVGVALGNGEYPDDGLMPGDQVLLVAVPDTVESATQTEAYNAVIASIGTPSADRSITVTVLIDSAHAARAAQLAALDRLSLVLSAREK
jgi:hypothetical protein